MCIVKKLIFGIWFYYTGKGEEWAQEREYALRMVEERGILLASACGGKVEYVKE